MRSLYVSDLDGTLLDSKKNITGESARLLNRCIEKGMLFTVATARMPFGCDYRLSEISLNVPGILTNGALIYDFANGVCVEAQTIPSDRAKQAIEIIRSHGRSCFLYTLRANGIDMYYGDRSMERQTQYYSERALQSCGKVMLTDDFAGAVQDGEPFYVALSGSEDDLQPILADLQMLPDITCVYYKNVYNEMYCLEILSDKAGKRNAILRLKEMVQCDELIVFGDNLNDLSMIELADRSYAPANALSAVKEKVTGVIDGCDQDGVARFLANEWGI